MTRRRVPGSIGLYPHFLNRRGQLSGWNTASVGRSQTCCGFETRFRPERSEATAERSRRAAMVQKFLSWEASDAVKWIEGHGLLSRFSAIWTITISSRHGVAAAFTLDLPMHSLILLLLCQADTACHDQFWAHSNLGQGIPDHPFPLIPAQVAGEFKARGDLAFRKQPNDSHNQDIDDQQARGWAQHEAHTPQEFGRRT